MGGTRIVAPQGPPWDGPPLGPSMGPSLQPSMGLSRAPSMGPPLRPSTRPPIGLPHAPSTWALTWPSPGASNAFSYWALSSLPINNKKKKTKKKNKKRLIGSAAPILQNRSKQIAKNTVSRGGSRNSTISGHY